MTGGHFVRVAILVLSVGAAIVQPQAAVAHRLNLFAVFDGTRVVGEAYFTGGASARALEVGAVDATGKQVATVRTDDQGAFVFPSLPPSNIQLIADIGDGHVARFRLSAAEFGSAQAPAATLPWAELEQIVERAVARGLAPLRLQIAAYEAKVWLHDILGGLGYLVGLAGLGFWLLARHERLGRKP